MSNGMTGCVAVGWAKEEGCTEDSAPLGWGWDVEGRGCDDPEAVGVTRENEGYVIGPLMCPFG